LESAETSGGKRMGRMTEKPDPMAGKPTLAEANPKRAYRAPEILVLGDFRRLTAQVKGSTGSDSNNSKL
jgi:hypothetical protein